VLDGEDQDGIAKVTKANAVVIHTQAKLGRLYILKALDIAFPGGEETGQSVQNAEGHGLVDSEVGFGLFSPADLL
jgi:hypothetical protein